MIPPSDGISSDSPIDALETTLGDLLSGGVQLRVPIYQRPFKWGQKDESKCNEKLVNFIKSAASIVLEDAPYGKFFGFLVCLPKPESRQDVEPYYNVIDGQQRLTTLSLICIASCDIAQASVSGPSTPAEKAAVAAFVKETRENFVVFPEKIGDDRKVAVDGLRLRPARDDRDAFLALVNGERPDPESPIGNGYRLARQTIEALLDDDFTEKFSDTELTTIAAIQSFFEGIMKMHVVQMKIEKEELGVNSIFESINYAGERLSDYDLIRNKVIEGFSPSVESEANYERRWQKMEDAFREAFGFDSYERKLEKFVYYYLRIKAAAPGRQGSGSVSTSNIFKKFNELVFRSAEGDARRKIITDAEFDDVLSYAYRYLRLVLPCHEPRAIVLVLPEGVSSTCKWSESTAWALQSFGRLGVEVPVPFFLEFIAKDGRDDRVGLLAKSLVNFFVRYELSGGSNRRLSDPFERLTNRYVQNFTAFNDLEPSLWLRDELLAKKNRTHVKIYPAKAELLASMKERKVTLTTIPKILKFALIELNNRKSVRFGGTPVNPDALADYVVAHVLPENPGPAWTAYLNSHRLLSSEAAANSTKFGNLLLLPDPDRDENAAYDAIKGMLSSSPLTMMSSVPNTYPTWTYDVIQARTNNLATEIDQEFP